jgi:hypothetical protein
MAARRNFGKQNETADMAIQGNAKFALIRQLPMNQYGAQHSLRPSKKWLIGPIFADLE